MKELEIDNIRNKYPIPFDEICKYNSFEQVLGKNKDDISPDDRKKRWDKIMSLCGKNTRMYWADTTACVSCVFLEKAWCKLQELPCTVNPILTYHHGLIGMACCGAGKVEKEPKLFSEDLF